MAQEKRLPEKLSDCILLALQDLEKVEKDKRYKVDMDMFHVPHLNKQKCMVCFAGAVIAETLGAHHKSKVSPESFDEYTEERLYALDTIRDGQVSAAIIYDGFNKPDVRNLNKKWWGNTVEYKQDPTKFKSQMKEIATDLKNIGL